MSSSLFYCSPHQVHREVSGGGDGGGGGVFVWSLFVVPVVVWVGFCLVNGLIER